MTRRLAVIPDFFDGATELRSEFDRLVDPENITPEHFCWNYWNVKGQYTYLRTNARDFFPRDLFARLSARLCAWGKATLGCNLVNSWWLSFYVDGCRQEFHADVAHGPWAFVYSLTRWTERRFEGGETLLFRPEVLDYWRSGGDSFFRGEDLGTDRRGLIEAIPSHFDQLVVFDGRIPHGVAEVRGTCDPRDSRIVVHGWFEPPALQVDGGLRRDDVLPAARAALTELGSVLSRFDDADGTLISRLDVRPSGEVERVATLTDSLETSSNDPAERESLRDAIVHGLEKMRFPAADAPSSIILPVAAARHGRPRPER